MDLVFLTVIGYKCAEDLWMCIINLKLSNLLPSEVSTFSTVHVQISTYSQLLQVLKFYSIFLFFLRKGWTPEPSLSMCKCSYKEIFD